MARIRTIKPEFWRNEALSNITSEACLLAIGLLNHCDDEGYFNANPKLVESDVFPLRNLSCSTTTLLRELSDIGYINVFSGSDGKTYGHIVNFNKHQVINKKNISKIKDLCELPYDYGSDTVELQVGNGKEHGNGNGRERKKKAATSVACPDSVDQQVWNDWMIVRKEKGAKSLTETAWDRFKNQVEKAGWTLEQAISHCCLKNWVGFEADWVSSKQSNNLNKQEALEARNRAVVERMLAKEGLK